MVTIEPIKNQYLTALKERQQIIDKLNEIISGLNALDFDDLTTIHTELVAIRESLQTQNTAITEINNSIGQIETELTSFDNRLITLNTNIENTESNLTSFENDTALNLQSKVNKNGDTMTGNLGIPTTTTGSRDKLAINGERLQNDLDNYSSMLRNTGNSKFTGEKIATTPNGLGMETTAEYNSFRIKSNSFYNTIIANKINTNGEDRGWRIDSPYNDITQNNLSIRCYSPRNNFGDVNENQQFITLNLFTDRNTRTGRLSVSITLPDGNVYTKTLATFTNGGWQ